MFNVNFLRVPPLNSTLPDEGEWGSMQLTALFSSSLGSLWPQVTGPSSLLYFNTNHDNKYWNWLCWLNPHIMVALQSLGGKMGKNKWLHHFGVFNHRVFTLHPWLFLSHYFLPTSQHFSEPPFPSDISIMFPLHTLPGHRSQFWEL